MRSDITCEQCGGKLNKGIRFCSRPCYDLARVLAKSSPNAHRKWAQHNVATERCEKCGATASDTGKKTALDRHHPDIRDRLTVIVLCQRCHAAEHEHMRPKGRTCKLQECSNKHEAEGYCRNHLRLTRRYGVPWVVPGMRKRRSDAGKPRV